MHRARAYSALGNELEKWPKVLLEELLAFVDAPARRIVIHHGGEEFEIEIAVAWEGFNETLVRVVGTANGPSSWRLERLQKSIVFHCHELESKVMKTMVMVVRPNNPVQRTVGQLRCLPAADLRL